MSLTPVEIRHVSLPRRLLGYERSDVDRLLSDIASSFEDVWRDRAWPQARANLEQVLAYYRQGRVRPLVSATYPLERAVEAMRSITARKITGKVVLVNQD